MSLVTILFGWLLAQRYVNIPDGYHIDVDRDPPRFAEPCDRDNIVSINVPSGHLLGNGTLSLRYDEEDRSFGDGARFCPFDRGEHVIARDVPPANVVEVSVVGFRDDRIN